MAASMAAWLLAAGEKGMRRALPNSRIMIHQPISGVRGQASDIEIHAKEIIFLRQRMNEIMSHHTGQPVEKIKDDTERDRYMTAEQGLEYGILDGVIRKDGPKSSSSSGSKSGDKSG
jgi:ATP-dependent Clp protease protease subunit